MSRQRTAWPGSRLAVSLIILVAIAMLCLPATAIADLEDDIAAAFDEFINALLGTEIDGLTVEGDILGFHYGATLIGFAFCSPSDPWADPTPVPVPPYNNVYACDNAAAFDVVVEPGEETADILITIDPLFLDLEIERDDGLCPFPPYYENPLDPGPPHTSDAYMLVDASIALTLQLEEVEGCIQATIVPGSVEVTLGGHTRELEIQGDGCLAYYVDTLEPLLWNLLNAQLDAALETLIVGLMGDISEQLCSLTPVASSTWGSVKSLYRPATEGEAE